MSFRDDILEVLAETPPDGDIAFGVQPVAVAKIAKGLGLTDEEFQTYGKYKAKVNSARVLKRMDSQPDGHLVCVTATTPTALGEGKTTTTIGVCQALGRHLNVSNIATIRQPSAGPTFGMKGGAAGGGYAQVIPMDELNIHLTGDFHAVALANNLLAAAIDTRMFHESSQSDEALARRMIAVEADGRRRFAAPQLRRIARLNIPFDEEVGYDSLTAEGRRELVRLDIDPEKVLFRRVVDVNDRALRQIILQGDAKGDTKNRVTAVDCAAASEVMAILAMSKDLKDMGQRLRKIVVAFDRKGRPVTADDLCVAGAMWALMREAVDPTLMQTLEGTPVLVHAGPFANIAHGNSSIIADELALRLVGKDGIVVTEAGFGADIGFEKFCDIKCRASGRKPSCAVLVTSVRSLKYHGGAPSLVVGEPVPKEYKESHVDLVEKGICNLKRHIENCQKFGVSVVVAMNWRPTDAPEELTIIQDLAIKFGAFACVPCKGFSEGGHGAVNLGKAVVAACKAPKASSFEFLYSLSLPIRQKIEIVCKMIYRANGVVYSEKAISQLDLLEESGYTTLPICVAKTPYSFSHNATLAGAPDDFEVPVQEVRLVGGAGFITVLCGAIMTMPGLTTRPAFFDVDLDPETGRIVGLF